MQKHERTIVRYENAPERPEHFMAEHEPGTGLVSIQFQTVETGGGFTLRGQDLVALNEFLSLVVADAGPWQNESDAAPEEEPAPTPEEEATNG